MAKRITDQDDISLARRAAQGNHDAQQTVYSLAQPVIDFQTNRFCRRFCAENQHLYRCSLSQPIGSAKPDSALCEWGNASYGWMLDDLCKPERLQKYEARNGARLFDYLYSIANSLPFYERWKDWRFGRKQRVPAYIQSIGEQAGKVFYALRSQRNMQAIAQQLAMPLHDVEVVAQQIVSTLTKRHKLYLLDSPVMMSLTSAGQEDLDESAHQTDLATFDEAPEQHQQREQLQGAWRKLDAVEQFVLEALVVEEQDAGEVLEALAVLDISIKPGIPAKEANRQQLYYFKRKALSRLEGLIEK